MKIREFAGLLGFQPKLRRYGFEVRDFDPPEDARIGYARWLYPGKSGKASSQETLDDRRALLKPGGAAVSELWNGGWHEEISKWRHAHVYKLRVAGKNLETYLKKQFPQLLPTLSVIKIDTKGCGMKMPQSLSSVVAESGPFIKAEVHKHTNPLQREKLCKLFAGHHYTVHHVESDSCYRGQAQRGTRMMNWRNFAVFCTPEEIPVS